MTRLRRPDNVLKISLRDSLRQNLSPAGSERAGLRAVLGPAGSLGYSTVIVLGQRNSWRPLGAISTEKLDIDQSKSINLGA